MTRVFWCVGGPLHGQQVEVERGVDLHVPIMHFGWNDDGEKFRRFETVKYVPRRRIHFPALNHQRSTYWYLATPS